MKKISVIIIFILMFGCAANRVLPQAQNVEIVNEPPDKNKCKFLGEVAGSQGNFISGEWTSNKNLVVGARNELRNETYKLGGNVVYVQDMKNTSAWGASGTSNTTAIGKAYKCND